MIDWLTTEIDLDNVPNHVGIIMDGNGRWANARGLHRTQGHAAGEPALFDVVNGALDLGVKWLTVYTFSTENWDRDTSEVEFLMQFNVDLLERRRDELDDLGVRILFMGDVDDDRVPQVLRDRIRSAEDLTASNTTMTMVYAFNYGGRVEIVDAVKKIAREVASGSIDPDIINLDTVSSNMYFADMPDPDLVIRTSGEQRTSNFLLWEAAYSEYVFTPVLWPDFDRHEFARCVREYQTRDRRFGGAVDGPLIDGDG
jgi:undecaprenyl diphosphate synthase